MSKTLMDELRVFAQSQTAKDDFDLVVRAVMHLQALQVEFEKLQASPSYKALLADKDRVIKELETLICEFVTVMESEEMLETEIPLDGLQAFCEVMKKAKAVLEAKRLREKRTQTNET